MLRGNRPSKLVWFEYEISFSTSISSITYSGCGLGSGIFDWGGEPLSGANAPEMCENSPLKVDHIKVTVESTCVLMNNTLALRLYNKVPLRVCSSSTLEAIVNRLRELSCEACGIPVADVTFGTIFGFSVPGEPVQRLSEKLEQTISELGLQVFRFHFPSRC